LQPAHKTTWVSLGGPTWSSRSLDKLTREGYCKNVIAYRCITIVAECAAATPFLLFRGDKPLSTHPLLELLKTPNPLQSGPALMEAFYGHLQIAGNAYMELVENITNNVDELYVLRPDRMSIKAGPNGWPSAYEYKVGNKKHSFPVDQKTGLSDILHLKTFNPSDDYYGLSPLEPAAMSIDIHNGSQDWNKALLDNAARPSGALSYAPGDGAHGALSDEQFNRLKSELEESYQGAVNAGRPFLLEGGLKWQQIALTPQDMEFMATKNVAAREIALAFGVPPMILGIPGDNTYANYAEANRALWRLTLLPLLGQMCAGLNNWLTPRFGPDLRLEYDKEAIPALSHERNALWQRLDEADFLTDNEKRKMVGSEPIKGGDQLPSPLAHPQMPRGEAVAMPLSIDALQIDRNHLKKKAVKSPRSAAERLEAEPLVKIWRTVRDNRTRVSHVAAHGQVRFMDEPFIVGGVKLSGPRDPDGPPGETYNCRCLMELVPISQLPPDLLSQIKHRLSDEQRRFLDPGFVGNKTPVRLRGEEKPKNDPNVPVINLEDDRRKSIVENTPALFEVADNPKEDGRKPPLEWHEENTVAENEKFIVKEAKTQGVDPNLVRAIVYMETTHGYYDKFFELFDANSSILPMNVDVETWQGLGYTREQLKDPEINIRAGVTILRGIIDRIEDPTVAKVASLYNFLGREKINGYGARVENIYKERLWDPQPEVVEGFN
jgi:HK97 family phage portal protein